MCRVALQAQKDKVAEGLEFKDVCKFRDVCIGVFSCRFGMQSLRIGILIWNIFICILRLAAHVLLVKANALSLSLSLSFWVFPLIFFYLSNVHSSFLLGFATDRGG